MFFPQKTSLLMSTNRQMSSKQVGSIWLVGNPILVLSSTCESEIRSRGWSQKQTVKVENLDSQYFILKELKRHTLGVKISRPRPGKSLQAILWVRNWAEGDGGVARQAGWGQAAQGWVGGQHSSPPVNAHAC